MSTADRGGSLLPRHPTRAAPVYDAGAVRWGTNSEGDTMTSRKQAARARYDAALIAYRAAPRPANTEAERLRLCELSDAVTDAAHEYLMACCEESDGTEAADKDTEADVGSESRHGVQPPRANEPDGP